MENVVVINPERIGENFILTVNDWQLEEIKDGLIRLKKQRDYANNGVEKKRIEKGLPPKILRPTKPRLMIGDTMLRQQIQQDKTREIENLVANQDHLIRQMKDLKLQTLNTIGNIPKLYL